MARYHGLGLTRLLQLLFGLFGLKVEGHLVRGLGDACGLQVGAGGPRAGVVTHVVLSQVVLVTSQRPEALTIFGTSTLLFKYESTRLA